MALINYLARIQFGPGVITTLPEELAQLGIKRPLLVTDQGLVRTPVLARVSAVLAELPTLSVFDRTPPNPTEEAVLEALAQFQAGQCDGLVAVGGGSPIDLAKSVSLLAAQGGKLADYVAEPGRPDRIGSRLFPLIAVPTTAGSGAEVGRASVITLNSGRKKPLVSLHLIPKTAICDPELTLGLPPALTAATGMDAITHCIETYLSPRDNPPADAIGLDGLRRAVRHIERATADGADIEARSEMMMAALQGGMTFQKGLGAIHALDNPLGELGLHHGTVNAILLPAVLRFNAPAAPSKYRTLRETIGLPEGADLSEWAAKLNDRLGIPAGLRALGVQRADLRRFAEEGLKDNAAATNPRPATAEDYEKILIESW